MPPQYSPQPAPPPFTPQPGGQNPYNFIMSPQQPKRQSRFMPNPSTPKGRLLVALAGLFILLMIGWIVASLISSSGQGGTQALTSVAAHQQELIRISQLGVASSKNQDTKNLAMTAQLAISSDQQQLLGKIKVNKKALNARRNAQTDASFTQATQTNQFDATFSTTLQDELAGYQRAIQAAYNANNNVSIRSLLKTEMTNASNLLGAKPQPN